MSLDLETTLSGMLPHQATPAGKALLTRLARIRSYRRLEGYRPYRKQLDFHAAGKTYSERLLMAANRVGKTLSGGAEHAMHLTGRYPPWWPGRVFAKATRMWAASETTEMTVAGVQGVLMGRIEDGTGTGMIPKDAIVDWKKKQHGASGAIEFVIVRHGGGGDVQVGLSYCGFKSYDQGREKFQADTLDLVWLDEEPDEKLYFEAFTRISTTDGMCTMTFTPLKGATRVVRRFIMDKVPGTHVTTMTIEDAEHFTPEQRKRREEQYPEHEREARLRGVPSLGSGAVYPVPDSAISVKRFEVPDHWPQIGGIDFGHYDHPTGAVQLAWDVDSSPDEAFQKCYLVRAHRQRKATPALFVPNVLSWGRGWLPWAWPADGLQHDRGNSGLQVAQHYANQGLLMIGEHAQFIDKTVSVEPGITQILDAMLGGRFFVFDDLLDWFEEKRMYHRAEGKIVKIDEDLLCAMRYAWMMRRFASVPPRAKRPDRSTHKSWRTV